MRVFLQNRETGKLLGRSNAWVQSEQDALDFKTSVAALWHSLKSGLTNIQVLLRMDGATRDWDVILPLDFDWREARPCACGTKT